MKGRCDSRGHAAPHKEQLLQERHACALECPGLAVLTGNLSKSGSPTVEGDNSLLPGEGDQYLVTYTARSQAREVLSDWPRLTAHITLRWQGNKQWAMEWHLSGAQHGCRSRLRTAMLHMRGGPACQYGQCCRHWKLCMWQSHSLRSLPFSELPHAWECHIGMRKAPASLYGSL